MVIQSGAIIWAARSESIVQATYLGDLVQFKLMRKKMDCSFADAELYKCTSIPIGKCSVTMNHAQSIGLIFFKICYEKLPIMRPIPATHGEG